MAWFLQLLLASLACEPGNRFLSVWEDICLIEAQPTTRLFAKRRSLVNRETLTTKLLLERSTSKDDVFGSQESCSCH